MVKQKAAGVKENAVAKEVEEAVEGRRARHVEGRRVLVQHIFLSADDCGRGDDNASAQSGSEGEASKEEASITGADEQRERELERQLQQERIRDCENCG